jgi:hypothetical protein
MILSEINPISILYQSRVMGLISCVKCFNYLVISISCSPLLDPDNMANPVLIEQLESNMLCDTPKLEKTSTLNLIAEVFTKISSFLFFSLLQINDTRK